VNRMGKRSGCEMLRTSHRSGPRHACSANPRMKPTVRETMAGGYRLLTNARHSHLPFLITPYHTAATDGKDAVRQLPNEWRMADKNDLVEVAKVHRPA